MNLTLLSCAVLLASSCAKKEEAPRRTEPWLASPSAVSSSAPRTGPLGFRFVSGSSVRFTVQSRRARVTGTLPLSNGQLLLDPRDPEHTKASADFDLVQLSIAPESVPKDVDLGGSSATTLALQALELGVDVPAEERDQHRRARFELSTLENVEPGLDLGSAKGRAQATAIGSVLVHGFRAPVRARVLLQPLTPEVAGGPQRLSIRSLEPIVLQLSQHDVVARSAAGVVDNSLGQRLSDIVGKTVRVEFDVTAEADSGGVK